MCWTQFVAFSLLFLVACGPEAPVVDACPITATARVAAAPDDFVPAEDVWYGLHVLGDDILYTFDRAEDPDREYWRLNRCTGEVEGYPSLKPGLHYPFTRGAVGGRVVYANDEAGRPYVVDRLDDPGADEARPVAGLPEVIYYGSYSSPSPTAIFFAHSAGLLGFAAGIGVAPRSVYTHSGDPDVPAVAIGDRIISWREFDDTHLLLLEDSGEVHRVDVRTGEHELVQAGVRYLEYGFEGRTYIWQAMGDDSVEPVFVHDLTTGEDLQIAVNDFTADAWGRDTDSMNMGQWLYLDAETEVAAMIGHDQRIVAAVRLDTGEALPVPEHREQYFKYGHYFGLIRDDAAGGAGHRGRGVRGSAGVRRRRRGRRENVHSASEGL